jgi:hypothetical protein
MHVPSPQVEKTQGRSLGQGMPQPPQCAMEKRVSTQSEPQSVVVPEHVRVTQRPSVHT